MLIWLLSGCLVREPFYAEAAELPSCSIGPAQLTSIDAAEAVLEGAAALSEIRHRWSVDGESAGGCGAVLEPEWFRRDQEVSLLIEAVDDVGASHALDCGSARVGNAAPVGGVVALSAPVVSLGDDLQCVVTIPPDDPDGDDLSMRISWTVDGQPFAGEDGVLPGDTVAAGAISVGDVWTCALVSSDGEAEVTSLHMRRVLMLAEAPMQLQHVPAGSFTMGRPDDAVCADGEQSPHEVTLSRGVWMGTTEVTQAQFEAVTGFNPSHYEGCPSCPVERESWGEAAAFTGQLSAAFGYPSCYDCRARTEEELDALHDDKRIDEEFAYRGCRYICDDQLDPYGCGGFRLPTEAEWEHAARGGERYGSQGDFTDGGALTEGDCELCPSGDVLDDLGTPLSELMWYGCSSSAHTEPVAQLAPNALGLYDVSGNVFEWCNDSWDISDYAGDTTDPVGDSERDFKVLRGGAYDTPAYQSALGHRWMDPADSCYVYRLGFRIAMTGL